MRYCFGVYVLDTLRYELQRAGVPQALRPKAYAVLAYLLAHRDRVVTKQELLEQVWPGQFVEETTLASCIMEVRKALGDSGPTPQLVQTVRSRGYRFVAPVQEESPVSPPPAGPGGAQTRPPETLWTASPPAFAVGEMPPGTPNVAVSLAQPAPDHTFPAPVPVPHRHAPAAERRSLTVLWGALVDPLTPHRDLEEVQALVRTFHTACAEVIHGLEGTIGQYLSDAVVAYFGYPQGHDDDAQRSIRAGLRLIDILREQSMEFAAGQCAVRVGIHTGAVVVGALGGDRQALLAIGETPAMAARLKDLAPLGSVVISAATARLVEGYFPWQEIAIAPLAASDAPRTAYHVLGDSEVQTRFEVVTQRALTPFVGRDVELAMLRERWAQATDGLGQVVVLSGEAGIGKSRLVQVMKEQLAAEPHIRLEWRCSPYYQHSAWHPVIAHLHRLLRWHQDTAPEARVRTLEEVLTAAGLALPDAVPLLAALLSLPLPTHYAPPTLTPQQQKQKTLDTLCTWLLTEARRQPVLFMVEDLHWSDPSTLELLTLLIDHGPTARLLTLLTCRPEFEPPWTPRAHVTPLTLGRLSRSQVEDMIGQLIRGKPLPPAVVAQIVAKTDGVPLFVEELTTMVLEAGLLQEEANGYELTNPLPPLAIPTTLHGTLLARLDRLHPAKAVAQLGAAIGRTFAYALLQAIAPLDEATLQHGLRQLVEAELVYQRGVPSQATYTFKHALIRDAAYASMLRRTRQEYHQRIAQVLAERFPETVEAEPELLAHHLTEAGLHAPAVKTWQKAGQHSVARSAYVEAIAHVTKGLEVLTCLPETSTRMEQELTLLMTLGPPLMFTRGYAAPEVGRVYARARDLCEQIGELSHRLPIVLGLRNFYQVRGDFHTARVLGEQGVALAQRGPDDALRVHAHMTLAHTLFSLGEFGRARAHCEQGMACYDPQRQHSYTVSQGKDAGVNSLTLLAWSLWYLGYPTQALTRIQEALALAQRVAHPPSWEYALSSATAVYQLRAEVSAARAHIDRALAVSREQGSAFREAVGTIFLGWTLSMQGHAAAGIPQMIQGIAAYRATGAEAGHHYWLGLLAEAYGKAGQINEALTALTEALAVVEKNGECYYEAELDRLKGVLLLGQTVPDVCQAEACFQQALAIARRQQAKSWELRAALSLSRLWQCQGKRAAAYDVLAEVYGWFTEGFNTADLQGAKVLLDSLRA
jgi:DNA-binding winged helix-turn-helix (wHTH) protein/class 3 adenylate cyclase/predicted ATPase